ncbi:MAG: NADH:ubiquinone reductase (Na(+)-transporting) subunit C [Chlorobi bacterium]|nr:NADH:ubiquinone reductase (Na(+)-transporting) subunit C [Chlorobiota bacterium]
MDTNSNIYTFIYASVMVILVAAVLAFTAIKLQPLQEKNIRVEKMQNILQSVGIESTVENAETLYNKYITKQIVVNYKGEEIEGDAFKTNLSAQYKAKKEDKVLPVFFVKLDDGKELEVIPLTGKGLWGPIWGYVALENDFNTIYGAVFDHKGETPGLGAEINKSWFEEPFKGKTLFEGDDFVSITMYKGGKGAAKLAGDTKHGCDAISGGTITSKGLERMFKEEWLYNYEAFLRKNKK